MKNLFATALLLTLLETGFSKDRPNILFIYTDDQSSRTVSCYPEAYPWAKTPNIDGLAAQGVRFSHAYIGSWCMPSRATMLTGHHQHGIESMRMEGEYPGSAYDPKKCRFWPSVFREQGYTTAHIGKWHTGVDAGFGRDWDFQIVWNRPRHPENSPNYYDKQLISTNGGEPTMTEGYTTDNYTDWAIDENVGRLVETLKASGQDENTLIVFTSDQGFAWGQKGFKSKVAPYRATVAAPFIIRPPTAAAAHCAGRVIDSPVSGVDIPPTIFSQAGLELPWQMHGHDLSPLFAKQVPRWTHPAMLVHTGKVYGSATQKIPSADDPALYHGPGIPWYVMLSEGRHKYIRNLVEGETEELYDIVADPDELVNLAQDPNQRETLVAFRSATIAELNRTEAGLVHHLPTVAQHAVWKKHTIQKPTLQNIPSAVANDWDMDGHMDIISSWNGKVVLYQGPDWKMQVIHTFNNQDSRNRPRKTCIHSCLLDVDGDGDLDFCGSNQTVFWLECPDEPFAAKPWKYRTIDDEILGTHCLITGDVNRDGKLDLIANSGQGANSTDIPNSITWLEVPANPHEAKSWIRHVFADRDAPGASHYMGFGDMNGDGLPDIACAAKGGEKFPGGEWFAWWEQPEDGTRAWKKHLLAENQVGASNIIPADLDGDGKVDYAASRGHGKGILWFRAPEFQPIEIDPEIAFPHSLALADIDGDGDIDIATCGKEADGQCAWYENDGKGRFKRHTVAFDQGSYDLRILDMDGDGDLDFLIAGQASRNIVWLENPAG